MHTIITRLTMVWLLALALTSCASGTTGLAPTAPAVAAPGTLAIVVDGTVLPDRQSALRFEISGTVAEILVDEGDVVAEGDPLARLDARDLELAVERARTALSEAQAGYSQLAAGASAEALAIATAKRDQAAAQLAQVQGGVSGQDVAAAEAQLRQAQEVLRKLRKGADAEETAALRAQLAAAQAGLENQRHTLAAAKALAESQLEQAANTLRNLQDSYSKIYWDNRELEKLPGDLPQARVDMEAAALRQVRNAEQSLGQAQVAVENARQNEVTVLAAAQAQVDYARSTLDILLAAADPDKIAAAEAQVAQAQANLSRLSGKGRAGEVAAAEAGLHTAQAGLEQVEAPTRDVDLAVAQARIETAQVALRQAERQLEKATLRAPFAGAIGENNLSLGEEVVGPAGPAAMVIADIAHWKIETSNLTERDIVRITVGLPATLSFDALPELSLPGKVTAIKPMGKDEFGDINYTVTVTPDTWDDRLRWQMSATVMITP